MYPHLFLVLLLLVNYSLSAQVVNTEKLRIHDLDKSFILEADINFGLTSNKAGKSNRYGFRLRGELDRGNNKFLIFSGGNQARITGRSEGAEPRIFINNRFFHLRYNYDFSKRITFEAFSQIQADDVQLIKNRSLTGTGMRFQLLKTDSSSLYLGVLAMFEYEEEFKLGSGQPTELDLINRDPRGDFYLSAAYAFTDYFNINHVTYYQPKFLDFSDFRILSESILTVSVSKKVSFKTYLQFIYDSRPPDPIVPNTMYSMTTGLSFSI